MLNAVTDNLYSVFVLVALFGVTIFVHELGHFIAALWCGMVVDTFSIGFGPALWKKKVNGIVFRIGCIPFGGYVALPQLDPTAMAVIQGSGVRGQGSGVRGQGSGVRGQGSGVRGQGTEDGGESKEGGVKRELPPVAAWKRILVSLTGATGNILLAIGIAWIVYWIGMPAGPAERSSVVGYVDPESEAYKKGLRIGDRIVSVSSVPVENWTAFRMEAALHDKVALVVRSAGDLEKTITIPTEKGALGEQAVVGVDGRNLCMVLAVEPGMSAEKAGIRSGDIIVEFAGNEVFSRAHLIDLVNQHRDQTVPVRVRRFVDGEATLLTKSVTPEFDKGIDMVRIGIRFNTMAIEHDTIIRPLPSEQLRHHASAILRFLCALTTPKQAKAASGAVGGPVAIIFSYWVIVKASVMLAVWFTGFLNVNLAIINLLPIPVLDGGHIVFALWEVITRRPPGAKVVNTLVNAFAVLLIGLILLLCVRDVDRFTHVGRYFRAVFSREAGQKGQATDDR